MVNITFVADINEPDLYNDVKDLTDPFNLNIFVSVTNTYSATLYFQVSLVEPPEGYTNTSQNLGAIAAGSNAVLTFSPTRVQPSLTTGEYDESLTLKIEAFTDGGYTSTAGNQTLATDIHHFDHTDASWTEINHATFDDNGYGGWVPTTVSSFEGYTVDVAHFSASSISSLTPFYSLANTLPFGNSGNCTCNKQTFNTNSYTKARFVMHYKNTLNNFHISIVMNNTIVKKSAVIAVPAGRWVRFAFSVPIGVSVPIAFACIGNHVFTSTSFVDEIWVIAK